MRSGSSGRRVAMVGYVYLNPQLYAWGFLCFGRQVRPCKSRYLDFCISAIDSRSLAASNAYHKRGADKQLRW